MPRLRPIDIWIQNDGPNRRTLAYGEGRGWCDGRDPAVTVPSFSSIPVSSGFLDGLPNIARCCLPEPLGTVAVSAGPMSAGDLPSFRLAEHRFQVSRGMDTNSIVLVILPVTLREAERSARLPGQQGMTARVSHTPQAWVLLFCTL